MRYKIFIICTLGRGWVVGIVHDSITMGQTEEEGTELDNIGVATLTSTLLCGADILGIEELQVKRVRS